MMTTTRVVKTSVTAVNNSPIKDYVHSNDHPQPTLWNDSWVETLNSLHLLPAIIISISATSRRLSSRKRLTSPAMHSSNKKISFWWTTLFNHYQFHLAHSPRVYSLIWPIRGCAAGQCMVFILSVLNRVYNFAQVCPKQLVYMSVF